MLKRISRITNIGTFYDWQPHPPPELRKLTLIYGPNGTGKTTLCAILRSLARNDADILKGRKTLPDLQGRKTLPDKGDSRVEIELANGERCVWDGTDWSGTRPKIEIFDEQFVRENLYTDVVEAEHKRNLYRVIVGEEATKIANEINKLTKDGAEIQRGISNQEGQLKQVTRDLFTVEEFLALQPDPRIHEKIAARTKEVAAHADAAKIASEPSLESVRLPAIPTDFEALLGFTFEDMERDAEDLLSRHIERCGRGADLRSWIERGLGYARDDICPFCGQSLDGVQLVRAYRAIFSEAYRLHKARIQDARSKLENDFGEAARERTAKILARNGERVRFWEKYVTADWGHFDHDSAWLSAWKELYEEAGRSLDEKARSPLEAVSCERLRNAILRLEEAMSALASINERISHINRLIADIKSKVSNDQLANARVELEKSMIIKKRHDPQTNAKCSEYQALHEKRTNIESRKTSCNTKLSQVVKSSLQECEVRVNELLQRFGAGFTIREIKEERSRAGVVVGWQLEIRKNPVKLGGKDTPASQPSFNNTLSAGDRSALAFAFFIAQLELKPDLSERIVVLDDPFTSQDSMRRSTTRTEVASLAEKYSQIVLLSHDPHFLKEMMKEPTKCRRAELCVKFGIETGSSINEASIASLAAERGMILEAEIWEFLCTGVGDPADIAEKMRNVAEGRLKIVFGSTINDDLTLGNIISICRSKDLLQGDILSKFEAINKFSNPYHHENRENICPKPDPTEIQAHIRILISAFAMLYDYRINGSSRIAV